MCVLRSASVDLCFLTDEKKIDSVFGVCCFCELLCIGCTCHFFKKRKPIFCALFHSVAVSAAAHIKTFVSVSKHLHIHAYTRARFVFTYISILWPPHWKWDHTNCMIHSKRSAFFVCKYTRKNNLFFSLSALCILFSAFSVLFSCSFCFEWNNENMCINDVVHHIQEVRCVRKIVWVKRTSMLRELMSNENAVFLLVIVAPRRWWTKATIRLCAFVASLNVVSKKNFSHLWQRSQLTICYMVLFSSFLSIYRRLTGRISISWQTTKNASI